MEGGGDVVSRMDHGGREIQDRIFRDGITGRTPPIPVSPADLERAARRRLSRRAWAYIAGGAGSESTVRANRTDFDRWRLIPRILRDVSTRDLSTELLGATLPAPLLLAPVGVLSLAHRDADLAVARAAARRRVPSPT
jgi:lactate 2-monooxygenase